MPRPRHHPNGRQAAEALARTAPLVSRWIERVLAGHDPPFTVAQFLTLQAELARETDPKRRYALWEQMTRAFYDKVPVARYGDLFGLRAMRKTVKGFSDKTERPRFWGVWIEK